MCWREEGNCEESGRCRGGELIAMHKIVYRATRRYFPLFVPVKAHRDLNGGLGDMEPSVHPHSKSRNTIQVVAEKDAVTELLQSGRDVVQLYRSPGLSDSQARTLLGKVYPPVLPSIIIWGLPELHKWQCRFAGQSSICQDP